MTDLARLMSFDEDTTSVGESLTELSGIIDQKSVQSSVMSGRNHESEEEADEEDNDNDEEDNDDNDGAEAEDDGDYIPDSLAAFLAEADAKQGEAINSILAGLKSPEGVASSPRKHPNQEEETDIDMSVDATMLSPQVGTEVLAAAAAGAPSQKERNQTRQNLERNSPPLLDEKFHTTYKSGTDSTSRENTPGDPDRTAMKTPKSNDSSTTNRRRVHLTIDTTAEPMESNRNDVDSQDHAHLEDDLYTPCSDVTGPANNPAARYVTTAEARQEALTDDDGSCPVEHFPVRRLDRMGEEEDNGADIPVEGGGNDNEGSDMRSPRSGDESNEKATTVAMKHQAADEKIERSIPEQASGSSSADFLPNASALSDEGMSNKESSTLRRSLPQSTAPLAPSDYKMDDDDDDELMFFPNRGSVFGGIAGGASRESATKAKKNLAKVVDGKIVQSTSSLEKKAEGPKRVAAGRATTWRRGGRVSTNTAPSATSTSSSATHTKSRDSAASNATADRSRTAGRSIRTSTVAKTASRVGTNQSRGRQRTVFAGSSTAVAPDENSKKVKKETSASVKEAMRQARERVREQMKQRKGTAMAAAVASGKDSRTAAATAASSDRRVTRAGNDMLKATRVRKKLSMVPGARVAPLAPQNDNATRKGLNESNEKITTAFGNDASAAEEMKTADESGFKVTPNTMAGEIVGKMTVGMVGSNGSEPAAKQAGAKTPSTERNTGATLSKSVKKRIEEHRERMKKAMLTRQQQRELPKVRTRPTDIAARGQGRTPPRPPPPPKLTVPHAPKLATEALLGSKVYSTVGRHGDGVNDAPTTWSSGSPSHGADRGHDTRGSAVSPTQIKSGWNYSCGSPRHLTVPDPPRLATMEKLGEKPVPTNRPESITTRDSGWAHSRAGVSHVTKPVPFKLSSSNKPTAYRTLSAEKKEGEMTLAQSVESFLRKGLRDSSSLVASKREMKLTVPKTPKLSSASKPTRPLPKSTAELEEEMMAEFRAHPFKAKPVGEGVLTAPTHAGVPKLPKRELTTPEPFRLRTETRHAHDEHHQPTTEELLAEECKKQFHARPMPDLSYRPPPAPSSRKKPNLTTPSAPKLRTEERHSHIAPPPPTKDDIELSKQFHARPMPKFDYRGPPLTPRSASGSTASPRIQARSPQLSTSARSEKRRAVSEASRLNAVAKMREKERMAEKRKREQHMEIMSRSSVGSPAKKELTVPVPFHLQSEVRHEVYRNELEERKHREEEARRLSLGFKARPIPRSRRPSSQKKQKLDRELTEPVPFKLTSVDRHEHAQQVLREKIEKKEKELRRLSSSAVKARPVPKTLYEPALIEIAKSDKKLVEPQSPRLQTELQSKARRDFELSVQKRREEEELAKREREERKKMEEEMELREIRRLPVSEGGLIPTAEPINAVFKKTRRLSASSSSMASNTTMGSLIENFRKVKLR